MTNYHYSGRMPRGDGDVPLPCGPYGASLPRRKPRHLQGGNGARTVRRVNVARVFLGTKVLYDKSRRSGERSAVQVPSGSAVHRSP